MIYVAEGINLRRMFEKDEEFSHYRLAHIIDCLENGSGFTPEECGKMLAEIQIAVHSETVFRRWLFDTLEEHYVAFSEADKERMMNTTEQLMSKSFPPKEFE